MLQLSSLLDMLYCDEDMLIAPLTKKLLLCFNQPDSGGDIDGGIKHKIFR